MAPQGQSVKINFSGFNLIAFHLTCRRNYKCELVICSCYYCKNRFGASAMHRRCSLTACPPELEKDTFSLETLSLAQQEQTKELILQGLPKGSSALLVKHTPYRRVSAYKPLCQYIFTTPLRDRVRILFCVGTIYHKYLRLT